METFSALLAICAGNSPVTGEFPAQRLITRSFDVFSDLRPNKRLSKQSWVWWFDTPSHPLWRNCNGQNGYGIKAKVAVIFHKSLIINHNHKFISIKSSYWWVPPRFSDNVSLSFQEMAHCRLTHLSMGKMATTFTDDISKHIFLNENIRISIQFALKFVPKAPIDNIPVLDLDIDLSPKSHYLNQCWPSLLTHICGTRGVDLSSVPLSEPIMTKIWRHAAFPNHNELPGFLTQMWYRL